MLLKSFSHLITLSLEAYIIDPISKQSYYLDKNK